MLCFLAGMEGGSPSCLSEKRSKLNQDRAAAPKLSGHTKATCHHDGAGGSRRTAVCDHGGLGSSAIAPPLHPTHVFVVCWW